MNADQIGWLLIAVAVGSLLVLLASWRRPAWRRWRVASFIVFSAVFVLVFGLFASAFLSGWFGGID